MGGSLLICEFGELAFGPCCVGLAVAAIHRSFPPLAAAATAFAHLKTAGALAEKGRLAGRAGSINARGGGLFHVNDETCQSAWKDLQSQGKENPNHWEGKSKPGEAKSKFLSSANWGFSRACGRIRIASRCSLQIAARRPRRRAWACQDAPPKRLATRMEPRLLRKSRPAIHARLASGRARGLFG